eukprot:CAMPEP_0113934384 /NCGR_PEP_ID=MMETSP1339-20121228/1717_1 /TAXON_ID=94617 /ORGANISM="Fibrocapsa japonica" /LENGTH=190 /DNA_ID=CAMNT_0000936171 /DNA_START=169 /DNA_END=741 /DNA_ORIENTATION=+ /assembly_acc=CAM_ASM_000762
MGFVFPGISHRNFALTNRGISVRRAIEDQQAEVDDVMNDVMKNPQQIEKLMKDMEQESDEQGGPKARSVTGEELEVEFTDWDTPMVLDIYATWCGPCLILAPELDKVAQHFGDRLRVLKMDSEAEPEISGAFKVRGLPTIMFLQDGEIKARIEGALPGEELIKIVDYHLFDGPLPMEDDEEGIYKEKDDI